jgi:hypothetical protein
MRLYRFIILIVCSLFLAVTSCEKYGYNIPDGYPDDTQNEKAADIDTNLKVIDKSMYAKARVFPGLVDQAEPRVENA